MIKENRNLTTNIIKNTIKGMKIKIIIRRKETSKINKIIKKTPPTIITMMKRTLWEKTKPKKSERISTKRKTSKK